MPGTTMQNRKKGTEKQSGGHLVDVHNSRRASQLTGVVTFWGRCRRVEGG